MTAKELKALLEDTPDDARVFFADNHTYVDSYLVDVTQVALREDDDEPRVVLS